MDVKTELPRFLVVGGMNFIFTFAIFTLGLKLFGFGYAWALVIAWFAGNIFTYMLNYLWVFQPENSLKFRGRFIKYITAGAASVSLNLLALSALVEFWGADPFWAQVGLILPLVAFNFLTAKFWSLRKSRP